ncbi:hypothetical protein ES708_33781 [subsurface metagenome]
MKARVYYWKDPRYALLGLPGPSPVSKPTPGEVETVYKLFWQGEVSDSTTPEDIFAKFNIFPGPARLPPGIHHTSMSLGDIVALNDNFYLCMPVGWEKL